MPFTLMGILYYSTISLLNLVNTKKKWELDWFPMKMNHVQSQQIYFGL